MRILLLLLLASFSSIIYGQNGVGIGTLTPDASSILDLNSTDQGLLIPRMTTLQREGIGSPADGLMVYDTDEKSLWFYTATGGWKIVASGVQPWFSNPDGIFYVPNNVAIGSPSNKMDHFLVDSRANPPTTTHTMKLLSTASQVGLEILNPGGFALNSTGAAFFNGNVGIGTLPSPLNSAYVKATGPNTAAALLVEHDGEASNALHAVNSKTSGNAAYFEGNTRVSFGNFEATELSFFGSASANNATVNIVPPSGEDRALFVGTIAENGVGINVFAPGSSAYAGRFSGKTEFSDGDLVVKDSKIRLEGATFTNYADVSYDEANDKVVIDADKINISGLSGSGTRSVFVTADGDLTTSTTSSTTIYDTLYSMIHFADFEVYNDAGDELEIFNCGVRSNGDLDNEGKIVAGVHVPHNAEIISMVGAFHDNDSDAFMKIHFYSYGVTGTCETGLKGTITSTASDASLGTTLKSFDFTDPITVDNRIGLYTIVVESDEWGSNMYVRGVSIVYRIPKD